MIDYIKFVRDNCRDSALTPQTLGMLFERYAGINYDPNDPASCFSREITIDELKNIHPNFQSTNGCQWARSDNSYLGKKYHIIRSRAGGRVISVKLDGANDKSIKGAIAESAGKRESVMTRPHWDIVGGSFSVMRIPKPVRAAIGTTPNISTVSFPKITRRISNNRSPSPKGRDFFTRAGSQKNA